MQTSALPLGDGAYGKTITRGRYHRGHRAVATLRQAQDRGDGPPAARHCSRRSRANSKDASSRAGLWPEPPRKQTAHGAVARERSGAQRPREFPSRGLGQSPRENRPRTARSRGNGAGRRGPASSRAGVWGQSPRENRPRTARSRGNGAGRRGPREFPSRGLGQSPPKTDRARRGREGTERGERAPASSRARLWGRAPDKDGAGNGIRTRDFDLGKVALYH